MFSFGWSEIALTTIIIIIVVGPKEIPNLLKQIGSFSRSIKKISHTPLMRRDPNIASIENDLGDKIGMRVFVKNKKNNTGTITLEYKAADQLDRLVEIIKKNY